jgi:hypothetical protein
LGLVGGYPDGTFGPSRLMTRAEFITYVNRAFNYTKGAEIDFSDVQSNDWFYGDVAKSIAMGYTAGNEDGTFKPNEPISRLEAAGILYKVLRLAPVDEDHLVEYTDVDTLSDADQQMVNSIVAGDYFGGYEDKTLRMESTISRAEMIVILARAAGEIMNVADGTFGPEEGTQTITGNATINKTGITLQNTTITGDLYITEGVGDGDFYLNNVTVEGRTIVAGGGSHSGHVSGTSQLAHIIITYPDGSTHVVFADDSTVDAVEFRTSGSVDTSGSSNDHRPSVNITQDVPAGAVITIVGDFSDINIDAPGVTFDMEEGSSVDTITVTEQATGSSVNISGQVEQLQTSAQIQVSIVSGGSLKQVVIDESAEGTDIEKDEDVEAPEIDAPKDTEWSKNWDDKPSLPPSPGPSGPTTVRVRAISVEPTELTLAVGQTKTITATVEPDNASNKDVTWSTSNADIVTIDDTGRVTGVDLGVADITVTSVANSSVKSNIQVTVGPDLVVNAGSITVGDESPSITLSITADTFAEGATHSESWQMSIITDDGPPDLLETIGINDVRIDLVGAPGEAREAIIIFNGIITNAGTLLIAANGEVFTQGFESDVVALEIADCTGQIEINAVSVTGDAVVGATLGAIDLEPAGATVEYQWQRADVEGIWDDIANASSNTFLLSENDEGKFIRVKVIGIGDYTGTVISDPVGPVGPAISGLELLHTYPSNGQDDFYPKYSYITLEFSEDMKALESHSEITIRKENGETVLIERVVPGVDYPSCMLLIVNDNLELNTDYELYIPANTLESNSGKLYATPISISFRTAHTVLKGWVYGNLETEGSILRLIDTNGEEVRSTILGDGGYIFTNIDAGEYSVTMTDNDYHEYGNCITISGDSLSIIQLIFGNIGRDPANTGGELGYQIEGDTITFGSGKVLWYPADEGLGRDAANRVGVQINAPVGLDTNQVKVTIGDTVYDWDDIEDGDGYFWWYPPVTQVGQEFTATVAWHEASTQIFRVVIDEGMTLAPGP